MNPNEVEGNETLGHGVFDHDKAGKTYPPVSIFVRAMKYGVGVMSTDRMDYADFEILCVVHDAEALRRVPRRQFHGWYTFEVSLVRDKGLVAIPTASTDPRNEWHADVVVPNYSADKHDQIVAFATAVNAEAKWYPKPLNSQARDDIEQASSGVGE